MQYKDYYATLGVERGASADEIKRAYRKLARKYHPDVSKEADAEARFKDLAEAYAVLKDDERRAAYDAVGAQWQQGAGEPEFNPPPGWDSGFEFSTPSSGAFDASEHSEFFEALFGGAARHARARHAAGRGVDHHARIRIDLLDSYRGAQRRLSLRMPVHDAEGRLQLKDHQVDVQIPRGIRAGQQLRLAGQGGPGHGGGPPGDLFLEVEFAPHPIFRVDGRDLQFDLPLAPWEAALGADVGVPTPEGSVQLVIAPNTPAGRRLRLRGKGLPGNPPGDLFARVQIALPPKTTPQAESAWRALAQAAAFNPRAEIEGR
jgi:curved DNA-binding protein